MAHVYKMQSSFLAWQCKTRQYMVREQGGKPDDAIMPQLCLSTKNNETKPLGYIITVLNKSVSHSKLPEMKHIARHTNDPAQRREKALKFLGEYYYQYSNEFSDCLTATFQQMTKQIQTLLDVGKCILKFDASHISYQLPCKVNRLQHGDAYFATTWWHNFLFNPNLSADTVVVAFQPNWEEAKTNQPIEVAEVEDW
ncbi:MAG: hypothetical protein K0U45_02620 [Alphaproteobacteria bacterium]|nr:hypothetical protein [Alphaproteobacteria bacterium]